MGKTAHPLQCRATVRRTKENLRLGSRREDVNMRRSVILEIDHETQALGTMDGRHEENNPSDGLFKDCNSPCHPAQSRGSFRRKMRSLRT